MDNDQTPINGDLERRPAAPAPIERRPKLPAALEDVALTLEDKLFWRLGDGIRSGFEVVRWPFERFAWALQRSLLWPLEDRAAELDGRGRAIAAGSGAVVVAVIAVGAFSLAGSGGSPSPAAT
ncbi:MAG: hypothetical protein H0X42_03400, partial [Solirubrobacterales bacterium]|nr:hypothetical protein [Solirubrobacterales bacterium]